MALSYDLNPLVFLYQDLNVLLKDSIKLLDMSSLKSLTTICVEPSNVFLTGSLYEGKPSVTTFYKKENSMKKLLPLVLISIITILLI